MNALQQDGAELRQKIDVGRVKRPISERQLQANRANAKRSTGPRTKAGKAVSRGNALKHGILSRVIDLPPMTRRLELGSLREGRSLISDSLLTDSALQDMQRIRHKMARILAFERDCRQRPDGLEQNGRLIHRYERTLASQLHARIRELAEVTEKNGKGTRRTL